MKKILLTLALWALVISASICSSISVSFAQDGKGTETSTTAKGSDPDASAPKKKGGIRKTYVAAGILVVGVIVFIAMRASKKKAS